MAGLDAYRRAKRGQAFRESVRVEADRILAHLASMASAESSCLVPVLRLIMLQTTGRLMVAGVQREIVSKHIGGGVYRISLSKDGDK